MNLSSYELAVYVGCLDEERTMSDVAEFFYPDQRDAVRSQISRQKVLDSLLDSGLLIPKRDGQWRYIADEQKAYKVLRDLGLPEKVALAKTDSLDWIRRVADRDKPEFQHFDRFLRNALIIDYLEQNRGLEQEDLKLVEQLEA